MVNNLTFGRLNYDMQANRKRKLTTKVTTCVQNYKRDITQALQDPTFTLMMDKLEHATDPMKVIEALERIGTCIDETITITYRNLKSTPKHWRTKQIHHVDLLEDTHHKPPAQLRKAKKAYWNTRKDSHTKSQNFLEEQIKKAQKTKDMDK
eukprot:12180273-Ditylum_brightwellii.AAC.3